jgi:hypothetical protein
VHASGDGRRSMPEPGQSPASIDAALGPYRDKVTRCVQRDDVELFVHQLIVSLDRDLPAGSASRTPGTASFDR